MKLRHLLLRWKAMTNLGSLLKSRDITLSTKVHLVKAMVFPVVVYGCEIWAIKKAEHWRIDAFELWCWGRLLDSWTSGWTAGRSHQSILKEISPEYSLEGLMLKLKLQHFGHLMWRTDSLEKTLILGKTEGRRKTDDRGWDGSMASPRQGTWVWIGSWNWWWTGKPGMLQCPWSLRVGHDWGTVLTEFNTIIYRRRMLKERWNDSWVNIYWALILCLTSEGEKEIISVLNMITVQCDVCEERFVQKAVEVQGWEQLTAVWCGWYEW